MNNYPTEDLTINYLKGMAYQTNPEPIDYNHKYLKKIQGKTLKKAINKIRKDLVDKHSPSGMVLDVGCGDGSFLDVMKVGYGYDVIPEVIEDLREKLMFIDPYLEIPKDVTSVTMWDSLEHMKNPNLFLSKITNQNLFVSIPIIEDIRLVRQWHHYRPDEHLWYFTNNGFLRWMSKRGFQCVDFSDAEEKAGREDISSYVFRRKL